jgi:hypothetical protein
MIAAGIIFMLPHSPWALVASGTLILFFVMVSMMPSDQPPG